MYDFRRNLPRKERESDIRENGTAFGHGKRKRSVCFATVKAGSGKVTINGKPMIEYFPQPWHRQQLLLPLTLTSYTCLLDVNLKMHGGGNTGQAEAAIPAIAKAIAKFDISTRPTT